MLIKIFLFHQAKNGKNSSNRNVSHLRLKRNVCVKSTCWTTLITNIDQGGARITRKMLPEPQTPRQASQAQVPMA